MDNLSRSQPIERLAPFSAQSLRALLRTMRPRQWIKNVFLFAAIAFSEGRLWYNEPLQLLRVIGAFIAFCMAASAIYLINDLVDMEKDRAHPKKTSSATGCRYSQPDSGCNHCRNIDRERLSAGAMARW